MVKRKEPMSEGKKNIIAALLQEYDIQTAEDIQDALKDLLVEPFSQCLNQKCINTLVMHLMSVQTALTQGMTRRAKQFEASMDRWRLMFHKTDF